MVDRSISFSIYLYGADGLPIDRSLETAAAHLQRLDRMYFEWDGSFVWTGIDGAQRWQVDGMIYDAGTMIQYVDLKGWCPQAQWWQLIDAIGPGDHRAKLAWRVVTLPDRTIATMQQFHTTTWG
jgi:hypothetical protein